VKGLAAVSCDYCGTEVFRKRMPAGTPVVCGPECLKKHRNLMYKLKTAQTPTKTAPCEICGTPFERVRNQKTCSNPACRRKLRNQRLAKQRAATV